MYRLEQQGEVLRAARAGSLTPPAGLKARVVYHPPGASAIQGTTRGMLAAGASRATIFKTEKPKRASGKKREK